MHFLRKLRHFAMLPTLWRHSTPHPSLLPFSTSPIRTAINPSSSQSLSSPSITQPSPQRYAIIGGGFAGVAVAWHLMKLSTPQTPIQIELFDAYGLGAGGSGAAAGLLHPYTPRGKLLWQGLPAFKASLDLVNAAEEAFTNVLDSELGEKSKKRRQFVWRHGLLRPARTAKQAKDFSKYSKNGSGKEEESLICDARSIQTYEELVQLVPGLDPKLLFPEHSSKGQNDKTSTSPAAAAVGFFVEKAVVINPRDYIAALWESCLLHARTSSPLASAQLHPERNILSLTELESQDGPFDGIVVSAGAAVDSIVETAGVLSLDLCQGYTLDMELRQQEENEEKNEEESRNKIINNFSNISYPAGAPGLLGSPYISPQGTHKAVVGATQRHECSLEEVMAALGPGSIQKKKSDEWKVAVEALVPAAAQLWPPVGVGLSSSSSDNSDTWQVATVRSGYRAIPQRTAEGSIPYAGKLNNVTGNVDTSKKNWWVVGGLGARGLVYHGWLGKLVAAGMVAKSDEQLPEELRRWKKVNLLI
jgi:glycine/D-amino acid oxidase-like deaminating enzyme